MTLKYFLAQIKGFTNNTDEFIVLTGYNAYILQPLTAGANYWEITVVVNDNTVDSIGDVINDNGLTQTYAQVFAGNYFKKRLLIPPSASLSISTGNADVGTFGQFIQGTLEEVAHLL